MGKIISVRGYANNEVAYVAWDIDGKINDCLGFEVTRVYVDESGNVMRRADGGEDRVKCAAWVAFEGQRNPNWTGYRRMARAKAFMAGSYAPQEAGWRKTPAGRGARALRDQAAG
jgi:hypothetical protein